MDGNSQGYTNDPSAVSFGAEAEGLKLTLLF